MSTVAAGETKQESRFVHILVFLGAVLKADRGSCSFDPYFGKAEMTCLVLYEHTGGTLVDFVLAFASELGRLHCLFRRRNCLDRSC